MKQSIYNHFIELGDKILCYNAFTNSFIVTTPHIKNILFNTINTNDSEIFRKFTDCGFFIKDDINELNDYLNDVMNARLKTSTYMLGINPTIDCNLNCWYCYERHIPSKMSLETLENIFKHIIIQFNRQHFERLNIAFFGGEPLLYMDIIKKTITETKKIAEKYGFKVFFGFTTNATLINQELLSILKEEYSSFQITLDGDESAHNKTRKLKLDGSGTYQTILKSISQILNNLPKPSIRVRINVSLKNINNLNKIIDDITQIPNYTKLILNVHKVWQDKYKGIDEQKTRDFVKKCQNKNIKCIYTNLEYKCNSCYADNLNEAIINYDGLVYKCTARDFIKENSCGKLNNNGEIKWDTMHILKRLSLKIPTGCLKCNLLPSCPKHCSQYLLDSTDRKCMLDKNYSMEDYIIQTFNNTLIDYKTINK